MKGKGEVMFGEVVGWQREGRGGPVTEWVVDEVCSQMEGGVTQAYVG